ncbi:MULTISPECIES: nuclear transport factor 2 family protein [Euryhalocaulis]|uniref:nuclear transport factor 2 family protein n=1 Tax=Euryhalocaulis TaxID=1712422 RepID=UPI0003A24D5C|nr:MULTISPECIES: nuclear transport factor 2 family protein [Euryhalocaulis]MBA4800452.1 nuclear transport factor 2 family protein [Euryhalocaulis sp.]
MSEIDPKAIQAVIDKQAIQEKMALYSRAVDRADVELLRTMYHPDATEHHGGTFDGSAADYLDKISDGLALAKGMTHLLCNCIVELNDDGKSAIVESYILTFARMKLDGKKTDTLTCARTVDRFEKRDGDWRIAARRMSWEWNRDMDSNEGWAGGMILPDPKAEEVVRGQKKPEDILYLMGGGR